MRNIIIIPKRPFRLRRVVKGALVLVVCAHLFSFDIYAQASVASNPLRLTPHRVSLSKRKTFNLYLPKEFEITVAAKGLRRVRFMAESPDKRIFVTDMYNRTDNSRGAVYILGDFDEKAGYFASVTPFLTNLRNPNSIAFYTDKNNKHWFYLALTDKLVRYRYREGES